MVRYLWQRSKNGNKSKNHRVVLAPLRMCAPVPIFRNGLFFSLLSSFYTFMAQHLTKPQPDRLPYMTGKTRKRRPIFGQT